MSVIDAQLESADGEDLDFLGRGWRFMCRRRPGEPRAEYRERIRLARDGLARCDFCGNVKDAARVSQRARLAPGGGEARMACAGEECGRAMAAWVEEGKRRCAEAERSLRPGDYVRWWPDARDDRRYSDGEVTGPASMRIASHGPRWSSTDGLIGHEVTRPRGRVERIERPAPRAATWDDPIAEAFADLRPLDDVIDGIKLRDLLWTDEVFRRESNGAGVAFAGAKRHDWATPLSAPRLARAGRHSFAPRPSPARRPPGRSRLA